MPGNVIEIDIVNGNWIVDNLNSAQGPGMTN